MHFLKKFVTHLCNANTRGVFGVSTLEVWRLPEKIASSHQGRLLVPGKKLSGRKHVVELQLEALQKTSHINLWASLITQGFLGRADESGAVCVIQTVAGYVVNCSQNPSPQPMKVQPTCQPTSGKVLHARQSNAAHGVIPRNAVRPGKCPCSVVLSSLRHE